MNELMKLIDTVEIDDVATSLNKVARVQQAIAGTLKSGQDFDTIPGTNKPTLLKPGAEKILMMFGLTSEFGKYKGQLLGEIFDKDTSYVTWLANNARDAILKQGAAMLLNNNSKTDENNVENMETGSSNGFLDEENPFMTDDVPFA